MNKNKLILILVNTGVRIFAALSHNMIKMCMINVCGRLFATSFTTV